MENSEIMRHKFSLMIGTIHFFGYTLNLNSRPYKQTITTFVAPYVNFSQLVWAYSNIGLCTNMDKVLLKAVRITLNHRNVLHNVTGYTNFECLI